MVAGHTGTVCHRPDPDVWARAIAATLTQPARTRMSQSARQYALTRTWERAMQPLYRAYHDVIAGEAAATSPEAVTAAVHRV
jgi:HAMP domain-containing protein